MVDPRAKGAKAEIDIRDTLRKYTGLKWERVPGSGALNEKHLLKGDLYIPGVDNVYCVECKHYESDHLTSVILTSKTPQLLEWWGQAVRQGKQVNKVPLLIFKHNRSKLFVAFPTEPTIAYRTISIDAVDAFFYVSTLENWLINEKPKFVR